MKLIIILSSLLSLNSFALTKMPLESSLSNLKSNVVLVLKTDLFSTSVSEDECTDEVWLDAGNTGADISFHTKSSNCHTIKFDSNSTIILRNVKKTLNSNGQVQSIDFDFQIDNDDIDYNGNNLFGQITFYNFKNSFPKTLKDLQLSDYFDFYIQ